jgi:Protein of unknown function (DUF2283)
MGYKQQIKFKSDVDFHIEESLTGAFINREDRSHGEFIYSVELVSPIVILDLGKDGRLIGIEIVADEMELLKNGD